MNESDRFRVWHKKLNKYVELLQIHYSEDTGIFACTCCSDVHNDLHCFMDDIVIEQSYGETDRHKKIIFEGDIVQFQHTDDMLTLTDDGEELDEPQFNEEAQVSVVKSRGKVTGNFGDFSSWLIEWGQESGYIFEVIGNIHEDKEVKDK